MSPFKEELIKTAFDKGLIGILILLFGFILSKAIEKLKAKNIYYQKLSEAKICAYQQVAKALTVEWLLLQNLHRRVFANSKEGSSQKVKEVLRSAEEEYRNSYVEKVSELSQHSLFFSRELGTAINLHWETVHEFWNDIPNEDDVERIVIRFDDIVMESSSSLSILRRLQDEVKTVPGEEKRSLKDRYAKTFGRAEEGAQPQTKFKWRRKVKDLPHIGRQSRRNR